MLLHHSSKLLRADPHAIQMLKMNVSISTWVLVGAILQSLLVLALPARYAIFTATLVLAIRFLDTILVALCAKQPPHGPRGRGENCAQIPDRDGNSSAAGPGGENIVIFLLRQRGRYTATLYLNPVFRDQPLRSYAWLERKELVLSEIYLMGYFVCTHEKLYINAGTTKPVAATPWRFRPSQYIV